MRRGRHSLAAVLAPSPACLAPAWLSLAFLSLTAGCITPPAVATAPSSDDYSLTRLPRRIEHVELAVTPDVTLRGVFVPSDADAPVVVHFLESGTSISSDSFEVRGGDRMRTLRSDPRSVLWELADHGYASLVVDYTGVGVSDGERDPGNLRRDARALWSEAVRRTGGRPERVILRGCSLGSVAAALLLRDGVRPGALVLVTPILADTVAYNFSRNVWGWIPTVLVSPLLEDVADVRLEDEIRAAAVPTLVFGHRDDELLPPDDARRLRDALAAVDGRWIELPDGNPWGDRLTISGGLAHHIQASLWTRGLLDGELDALRAAVPVAPPVERRIADLRAALPPALLARFSADGPHTARLVQLAGNHLNDDPALLAMLGLAGNTEDVDRALLRFTRDFGDGWLRDYGFDERVLLASLADPAGSIDADVLRGVALQIGSRFAIDPWSDLVIEYDDVVSMLRGCCAVEGWSGLPTNENRKFFRLVDCWAACQAVAADERLSQEAVARHVARIVLKATGFVDRASLDGAGRVQLEALVDGEWRSLDPSIVFDEPDAPGILEQGATSIERPLVSP